MLDNREPRVDDRVEQRIGEIVRSFRTNLTTTFSKAITNRLETVAVPFLKGQHETFADEDTDLLSFEMRTGDGNSRDQKKRLAVELGLWLLMNVDDVFQGKRMKTEDATEFLNRPLVTQPRDIDPGNRSPAQDWLYS